MHEYQDIDDNEKNKGEHPFRGAAPASTGRPAVISPGMRDTMAPGLPYAIAAQLAIRAVRLLPWWATAGSQC
jgi:hypothetical protein